ncbi:MAG: hypothetical protein OEU51_10845 [Gammaproteobacteria bacterium]|nr:hypothetical protein [Gammaproteobacteria bacterium]
MIERRLMIYVWVLLLVAVPRVAAPIDLRGITNQFAHPASSENQGISLDEAIARARQESDGKILSAETVRDGGRNVHRIKILTRNGRVKRMQYDAASGRPAPRGR